MAVGVAEFTATQPAPRTEQFVSISFKMT